MAGHFALSAVFATVRPPLWAPLSIASIPFEATCFAFAGALAAELERDCVERERVPLERARPFEERDLPLERLPLVERDRGLLDLDLLPVLWAIGPSFRIRANEFCPPLPRFAGTNPAQRGL
jgi:hypothetical protein